MPALALSTWLWSRYQRIYCAYISTSSNVISYDHEITRLRYIATLSPQLPTQQILFSSHLWAQVHMRNFIEEGTACSTAWCVEPGQLHTTQFSIEVLLDIDEHLNDVGLLSLRATSRKMSFQHSSSYFKAATISRPGRMKFVLRLCTDRLARHPVTCVRFGEGWVLYAMHRIKDG